MAEDLSVWVIVDEKYGPLAVYNDHEMAIEASEQMYSPSGMPLAVYEFEVLGD